MLKGISSWRIIAKSFSLKFVRLLDSERPALRSVWRLIFFWLEKMIIWYLLQHNSLARLFHLSLGGVPHPSAFNCFSLSGTLAFHHFQSEASLANRFPEAVAINVESCAISTKTMQMPLQQHIQDQMQQLFVSWLIVFVFAHSRPLVLKCTFRRRDFC